jgi:hypothetical protein
MIISQLFLKAQAQAAALAWTALGTVGNATSSTGGAGTATISVTVSTAIPAGSVVFASAAMQSSASAQFGTCTDSAGNTWTLVDKSQGIALYYSKLTNALNSGSINIPITSSSGSFSPIHASAWKFSVPAGATVNKSTPVLTATPNFTDTATLSGLTSREYLFFRVESGNGVQSGFPITATSGFTLHKYTQTGALGLYSEYVVETGTGKTSNPTGTDGVATNGRSIFTAFWLT